MLEVKNLPANTGDMGSIPGLGRSPGEGDGNPLQYSCLGNPMDRGAWQVQSMGSQRVRHDLATKQQQQCSVTNIIPLIPINILNIPINKRHL